MRQVWPICGDGLDLEIRLTPSGGGQSRQLMWREITTNAKDKPQRQKVGSLAVQIVTI